MLQKESTEAGICETQQQKWQIKSACLLQFNLSITIFQRRFLPIKILGCNSVNSSIKSFRFSETAAI